MPLPPDKELGVRPPDERLLRPKDTLKKLLDGKRAAAQHELVVEKRTGRVRQAGAAQAEGDFVRLFKQTCERSLFAFLDGVLNYWFLEPQLHRPVCDWLTRRPPYRKMLLMPRNHGKSTIVGRGIPLHAMIQPKESNLYYEGQPGANLRLVLACETEANAVAHMRTIKAALENNILLRALWPHVCWDNPRKQASKWSDSEIIIPRPDNFAESTVRAIGVGGAITGWHPNMLIKDDLTTQTAANEPTTMATAIDWHNDSRALFANPDTDLEFITATRWAAFDLPGYVEDNDPTVEVNTKWRRVVEDGSVIFPSKYGYERAVEGLMKEHGVKFHLLFMNEVAGGDLTDFLTSDLREYTLRDGKLLFTLDDRDEQLAESMNQPAREPVLERGMDFYTAYSVQNLEYLRNTRAN